MVHHVPVVPNPEEQPTVELWPTAARALGIGRSLAYERARSNDLPVPVLRIGGKFRVPTAALRRVLALDVEPQGDAA